MSLAQHIAAMVRDLDDAQIVELHSLAAIGQRHLETLTARREPPVAPVAPAPTVYPTRATAAPAPAPAKVGRDRTADIYRAIVGAEAPLSTSEIAAACGISMSSAGEMVKRLVCAKRIFRGCAGPTWTSRYSVTQAAADAGARAALKRSAS